MSFMSDIMDSSFKSGAIVSSREQQTEFPPLAHYEVEYGSAEMHSVCVVGSPVGCKECDKHRVHFKDDPATRPVDEPPSDDKSHFLTNDEFSTTGSSDGDACENAFDPKKCGDRVELLLGNKVARRKMPIGGSRLVVGQLGACSGQVIWRVRIDRTGLDKRLRTHYPTEIEAASRMIRTNVHGIKVGVAQKGANLNWFAGFDKHSYGLDWQGDVWSEGKPIKTHLIDGGQRRGVCFKEGDVVSVIVEFNSEKPTLKYAVNDVPLPGAYYLSAYKPGQDLYVAVSLLWPGEHVTFLSEELYE